MCLCGTIAISFCDYGGIHDYAEWLELNSKMIATLSMRHYEVQNNLELAKAGRC